MKSWKEVPHLFCNGKFEVIHTRTKEKFTIGSMDGNFVLVDSDLTFLTPTPTSDYKLIARPISDLSDEEKLHLLNIHLPSNWSNISNIKVVDNCYLKFDYETDLSPNLNGEIKCNHSFKQVKYLLSIGVYPFNQDNPKDVIWRYENEDKER